MYGKEKIEVATEVFNKAYKLHIDGRLDDAIEAYLNSIYIFPTAKAHTFLGWAYSLKGKFRDAIEECKIAIELDPDFGNPYNDIGSYLISLGEYTEAVIWLEKALEAPDYDPRYYPFYNLGLIYEKKGDWITALNYYKDALEIKPDYEPAKKASIRLTSLLN